ncbi:putative peroxidase [Helianthus annuus]|nr:putative peroxidase [Helianthus annuus]KAJ0553813.1 putative peroxidase [Helianthus annuus]KAJ0719472.1 putative peroxidase [Helianthus annuus]KAJ0722699.1 putative peroxidase [Helianthus annuus]KAJ0898205.1 putative peroxidase [Helianthus annuus]
MIPRVLELLLLLILVVGCHGGGGLKMKYYEKLCDSISVENTVREIVWSKVAAKPALAAKLLRLHYHDCFVRVSNSFNTTSIVLHRCKRVGLLVSYSKSVAESSKRAKFKP